MEKPPPQEMVDPVRTPERRRLGESWRSLHGKDPTALPPGGPRTTALDPSPAELCKIQSASSTGRRTFFDERKKRLNMITLTSVRWQKLRSTLVLPPCSWRREDGSLGERCLRLHVLPLQDPVSSECRIMTIFRRS